MLYKLILKIKHKCPFSLYSEMYPSFEILHWCNTKYDIVEMRGESEKIKKSVEEINNELGEIIKIFPVKEQTQIIIKHCECDNLPFIDIPEQLGCVLIPPVKYLAGIEIQQVMLTLDNVQHLLTEYKKNDPTADIEIVELAPLKEDSKVLLLYAEEVRKELTQRQLHSVIRAYEQGYYDIPRSISAESIAGEMNINRRTFEDHLRKAEKKIMKKLIPLLNPKISE
ncbi:MAG: helix-turn-helix domain-containing protein [Candidatus Hodarchaeales archaeon]